MSPTIEAANRKEVEMEAMVGAVVAHEHWAFGWIFPLVWVGLILLFWGLFWRGRRFHHHHGDSAEQVLGERYARGEITEEEYRQRRAVIREH